MVWEIVTNKDGSVGMTFKSNGRDSSLTKKGEGQEQNESSSDSHVGAEMFVIMIYSVSIIPHSFSTRHIRVEPHN